MSKTWYVIANAATSRVFSQSGCHNALHLEIELNHTESKMKGSALVSDRPGHNQTAGNGRGAFVEKSDPKTLEAERFASELINYLDNGRVNNAFDELVIAATPHFHGLMNKQMNKQISNLVSKHIKHDLTKVPERELLEHINRD